MSIFSTIMSKIFSHPAAAATPPAADAPAAMPEAQATAAPTAAPGAPPVTVDVEAVLVAMAAKNPQTLNWRQSIVDLMKLLDLDSSFGNRQALAKELGYTGDMNDSAAMNIWLHKQVMTKLAENGGKVPADLKG
jgi:3-oxoacyl-ACP reductase-like protein